MSKVNYNETHINLKEYWHGQFVLATKVLENGVLDRKLFALYSARHYGVKIWITVCIEDPDITFKHFSTTDSSSMCSSDFEKFLLPVGFKPTLVDVEVNVL